MLAMARYGYSWVSMRVHVRSMAQANEKNNCLDFRFARHEDNEERSLYVFCMYGSKKYQKTGHVPSSQLLN